MSAIQDDREKLSAAIRRLLSELMEEQGGRRVLSGWVLREHAVLTADLHAIAAGATQFLSQSAQRSHAFANWDISYVPDGASFVATAPRRG